MFWGSCRNVFKRTHIALQLSQSLPAFASQTMLLKIESHMVSIHVIYLWLFMYISILAILRLTSILAVARLFVSCFEIAATLGSQAPATPSTWFKSWTSCRSGGCWVKKLIFKVIGWFGMSLAMWYSIVVVLGLYFHDLSWFVTCFGYVMCWLVSGFAMVDEVNMGFVFYMLHHTVCNIDCHDSLYGSIDEPLSRTKQKRWPTWNPLLSQKIWVPSRELRYPTSEKETHLQTYFGWGYVTSQEGISAEACFPPTVLTPTELGATCAPSQQESEFQWCAAQCSSIWVFPKIGVGPPNHQF